MHEATAPDAGARLVLGAVGPWDPAVLGRARTQVRDALVERHRSPNAVLLSAGPVESYGQGRYYWHALAPGTLPSSWRQASEDRMAAGLVVDEERAMVHTCALGVHDLYVRQIGGAVYFANRIEPLLDLSPDPLLPNWRAWASTIALCSPYGTDTPFLGIERLGYASAIEVAEERVARDYEPKYMEAVPRIGADGVSPLDVAVALDSALPTFDPDEPVNITLSGGWDSRLLAGLVRRQRPALFRSWTTSPDDGLDLDLEYARPVAEMLGTVHTETVPSTDAWVLNAAIGYRSFEHQTWLHTWFIPLATEVRESGGRTVDGVAGGVLLKSAFITDEALAAETSDGRRSALFRSLTGGRAARPDIYSTSALEWVEESAREAFDSLTVRFENHPSESSLHGLLGRTARGIAPSSYNLYGGPESLVAPYFHPLVVERALGVPEAVKARRVFNRQVIEVAAGRGIATLPSTNDRGERGQPGPRRQSSPHAIGMMAEAVLSDPVTDSLLDENFRASLADPERRAGLARWSGPVQVLQALTMLADWRRVHAARLGDDSVPWS